MLTCEGVAVRRGGKPLLSGISLALRPGAYHAIVGANGAGKTTLLTALSGLDKPTAGQVLLDGRPLGRIPAPERARRIAVVQQKEVSAIPFSAVEVALMGLHPWRARGARTSHADMDAVQRAMEKTDTLRFAHRRVDTLSGGEFQRLLIAKALLQRTDYLFLDEAMSEMDVRQRCLMQALLRQEIEARGLTVVAVHHDLTEAYRVSDRVVALKDGRLRCAGDTRQALSEPMIRDVFGVSARILTGKGIWVTGV